ncbi:MAG: hypothetical protein KKC19_02695 [Nanoarchaeota archaeon]|nr:hypothetical protein [Nanoarchaeota archaeon]
MEKVFLIISALAFIGLMIALRMNNFRTKIAYLFIALGVGFLLLTGFLIFSGKGVNVDTIDGVSGAMKTYVAWIGQATSNVIKVSSYAVNQEWKGDGANSTGG